jgi:hypothetical protein
MWPDRGSATVAGLEGVVEAVQIAALLHALALRAPCLFLGSAEHCCLSAVVVDAPFWDWADAFWMNFWKKRETFPNFAVPDSANLTSDCTSSSVPLRAVTVTCEEFHFATNLHTDRKRQLSSHLFSYTMSTSTGHPNRHSFLRK